MQRFEPKSPFLSDGDRFEPYGVGYLNLDDEVLVESRLTTAEPSQLSLGLRMELVIVPFATDADGVQLLTFAFAPANAPTAGSNEER